MDIPGVSNPVTSSSPCVLGYTGDQCAPSHAATWCDTRIGGTPIWPEEPAPEVPRCGRCGSIRFLVLQAFAPHPAHSRRSILLFVCNNIECSTQEDAWLAICVIELSVEAKIVEAKIVEAKNSGTVIQSDDSRNCVEKAADEIDWDDSDVDRSIDDDDNNSDDLLVADLENLFLQLDESPARKVRSDSHIASVELQSPGSGPSPQQKHLLKCKDSKPKNTNANEGATKTTGATCAFPCYYVDVDYETESTSKNSITDSGSDVAALLERYLVEEQSQRNVAGANSLKETWAMEDEEEQSEKVKACEKYNETIARSPEQILRYAFGNERHLIWPSAPSPAMSMNETRCHSCQGRITFELQLLSSLLYYLNPDACVPPTQRNAGLNFATVAMFTCFDECGANVTDSKSRLIYESERFRAFTMKVFVMPDDW